MSSHFAGCRLRGQIQGVEKFWSWSTFEILKLNPSLMDRFSPEDTAEAVRVIDEYEMLKRKGKPSLFKLVTINFPSCPSRQDIVDYHASVMRCMRRKWIKSWTLSSVFNQDDGSEGHPHVHFLVETVHSPSEFIRSFASATGLPAEKIDVENVTVGTVGRTLAYVRKSSSADVKKREEYSLDEKYFSINFVGEV